MNTLELVEVLLGDVPALVDEELTDKLVDPDVELDDEVRPELIVVVDRNDVV